MRRVRAPGAALEDLSGPSSYQEAALAQQRNLVAAWQASLPLLLPALAHEAVVDVLAARHDRVVVLTSSHVAYMKASMRVRGSVAYSVRWVLACGAVDHTRGAEESLRIILEYHRPLRVGSFSIKVPLHHSLRAASMDLYHRLVSARCMCRCGAWGRQAQPAMRLQRYLSYGLLLSGPQCRPVMDAAHTLHAYCMAMN